MLTDVAIFIWCLLALVVAYEFSVALRPQRQLMQNMRRAGRYQSTATHDFGEIETHVGGHTIITRWRRPVTARAAVAIHHGMADWIKTTQDTDESGSPKARMHDHGAS